MAQWDANLEIQIDVQAYSEHLCSYVPGLPSCVATSPHIWGLRLSNCDPLNEFESLHRYICTVCSSGVNSLNGGSMLADGFDQQVRL